MKRLFIIRHAKSSWDDPSVDDFHRPLNERGMNDAPFMGQLLKERNILPDIIITSPAKRAEQTAECIAKEINFKKTITPNQYLYDAYVTSLQETISYIYDAHDTAFLIGHNPGVSALAYMYCDMKENLPTCSIVEIEFDCDSWMDADKKNAKLISYEYPKKYQ